MGGKLSIDDLMKQVTVEKMGSTKGTKVNRVLPRAGSEAESVDISIVQAWIPHLVAMDFDRIRSIQAAFPSRNLDRNQARVFAQRLIKTQVFPDLMSAHIESIEKKLASSERYVLDRLYRTAEANIYDYFTVNEVGQMIVKSKNDLDKWQQQNIKKMKITNRIVAFHGSKEITEQVVELELVDSFKAVALLGKNMGMFIERVEVDMGKDVADRLQMALERVKKKKVLSSGHQRTGNQPRSARSLN